jgi:hypothetical protein
VTLLISLVGYNWFTNYRSYERDKSALMAEVQSAFRNEIATVKSHLSDQHEQQLNKLREMATQIAADKVSTMSDAISERQETFTDRLDGLTDDLEYLTIQLRSMDSERWEERGVIPNAIRAELAIGEIALKSHEWRLDGVFSRIETLLAKGKTSADVESKLSDFLERAPSKYSAVKSRIKARLEAV